MKTLITITLTGFNLETQTPDTEIIPCYFDIGQTLPIEIAEETASQLAEEFSEAFDTNVVKTIELVGEVEPNEEIIFQGGGLWLAVRYDDTCDFNTALTN